MLKNVDFYHLQENMKKPLLDTEVDSLKTASKKLINKAGEFLGINISDAVKTIIKL